MVVGELPVSCWVACVARRAGSPETWIDGWKRSERWGGTTSQCCRFGQKIRYLAPWNLMLHHHSSMYLVTYGPGLKMLPYGFFSVVYGLKLPNPYLPRVLLLITERSKEAKGPSVSKCIFPCDFSGATTDFNMARNLWLCGSVYLSVKWGRTHSPWVWPGVPLFHVDKFAAKWRKQPHSCSSLYYL